MALVMFFVYVPRTNSYNRSYDQNLAQRAAFSVFPACVPVMDFILMWGNGIMGLLGDLWDDSI